MYRTLLLLCLVPTLYGVEFALFTQPKTGTHLMVPLLQEITGMEGVWPHEFVGHGLPVDEETYEKLKEDPQFVAYLWHKKPAPAKEFRHELHKANWKGQFLYCNTPYSKNAEKILEARGVKVFTVLRDPRDTVVSAWQHYLAFGDGVIEEEWVRSLTQDQQIDCFIYGTEWHNSSRRLIEIFQGWQKSSLCCTVNFTNLLGLYGGQATEQDQLLELRKIANHLGLKKTDKELLRAFDRAYGIGYTFQKTRVGMWREVLTEQQVEEIGYESGHH